MGGAELRYTALLPAQSLARVHTALDGTGSVDVVMDARALLASLATPRDDCLVVDPALITPVDAEMIAANITEFPRAMIAYSSVTTAALESAVVLAQGTPARFVFRGTPNERSALERALLAPSTELGSALLAILGTNMNSLPAGLRERVATMFRNGDGPASPDALAAASTLSRRSLDRYLADAGLVSARRVIETARVMSAYRAIITSRTPLVRVAAMLGYKAQRTLDAQLAILLDTTSGKLRAAPLPFAEAARRLALRLTIREIQPVKETPRPQRVTDGGVTKLKLVDGDTHTRPARRTASRDR